MTRYPGYDVLTKRQTLSWNRITRQVVDQRLSLSPEPRFFDAEAWETLQALCARIIPQPADRPPVPLAAMLDRAMLEAGDKGFRIAPLPYQGEAWRRGLRALDVEALTAHGARFHVLQAAQQDDLLRRMEDGALTDAAWGEIPCALFFSSRVLADIPAQYYAHPVGWSEIGWGGPASPRGYVRVRANRRDPWEAMEAKPGQQEKALRRNRNVG